MQSIVRTLSKENTPGGRHEIALPARVVASAIQEAPLLSGLLATGAGFLARGSGPLRFESGAGQTVFLYCISGSGWCEMAGHLHTLRPGDLLVLPPQMPHTCGARPANPWALHWIAAVGADLEAYRSRLDVANRAAILHPGEDLHLVRLFNETFKALEQGAGFENLLLASHALAYLLALVIRKRHESPRNSSTSLQKVAEAIIYMSEHLDEPLRVTALARLANLSTAHFTVRFKEQTGCSPRDYLHLLRIHRACQLLRNPNLHIKEISAQLGYQDQFHFSRQFKAFQGLSPTEYRATL